MTDTTINNPSNTDRDARLDLITEQLERLTAGLQAFSGQVVSVLSGQPQEAPARRRGRPVGSKNRAKPAEEIAAKPDHPIMLRCVDLVNKAGRMTQVELAQMLSKETGKTVVSSHVAHHMAKAVEKGLATELKTYPRGVKTTVYYSPKYAHFKM